MLDFQTSLNTALSEIFPSNLTSIEQFHHFDCDESYPNLIYCRILLAGEVNPSHAQKAWQLVIQRQPMFNAEIKNVGGELHWTAYDRNQRRQSSPNFDFRFEELDDAPTNGSIPSHFKSADVETTENIGPFLLIRSWNVKPPSGSVASTNESHSRSEASSRAAPNDLPNTTGKGSSKTELWFWIHHVACDGGGAVAFINDWLKLYALLSRGDKPPAAFRSLRKLDQRSVKHRNKLGLCSVNFLKFLPLQVVGLFGATKFVFRKTFDPTRERTPIPTSDHTNEPALVSDWLAKEDYHRLNQSATTERMNLNAVLMSAVFRAITRWRLQESSPQKLNQPNTDKTKNDNSVRVRQAKDWIRLILPISIRGLADRRLPAVNRTSIVQIDRRNALNGSQLDLAKSVDREVSVIRNWQLDKIFLIAMRLLSISETLLRRTARNPTSRGFAVFTNLGSPFREHERNMRSKARNLRPDVEAVGIPEIIEFDFVGPIRNKTPFNFAFAVFAGRLRISLHFDPKYILPHDANDLLQQLTAELRNSTRESEASSS